MSFADVTDRDTSGTAGHRLSGCAAALFHIGRYAERLDKIVNVH